MQRKIESRPLALGLTILSTLARLAPHAPNVTPVGSSCLFAGSRLAGIGAYLLPLVVMLVTDPFVGGYSGTTPFVYASLLISVWLGRRFLRTVSPVRVGAVAFASSLQFFVFTNFGVWRTAGIYPQTAAGLTNCFAQALPFWSNALVGDLLFSAAIFGAYELLSVRTAEPDRQNSAAGYSTSFAGNFRRP